MDVPTVGDAVVPMIIAVLVVFAVGIGLQVFVLGGGGDYQKRLDSVNFWSGGLGFLGVAVLIAFVILAFCFFKTFIFTTKTISNDVKSATAGLLSTGKGLTSAVGTADNLSRILGGLARPSS